MERSEVKLIISPSSKLNISSGSEEDGWWKGSEDEADAECLYCASLFTADHNGEGWVACQKCLKWAHTVRTIGKGPLCVPVVRNNIHYFIVAAKCYEKLHFVISINKTSCFWPPYNVFLL
jgi:hypothetical protein